jgi:hypothetical protein
MPVKSKKLHPALKYGVYSATGLLPGENPAAFEKLRRDLIAEFRPEGPAENDVVETIARLTWRKQNLETLRIAEAVRKRHEVIWSKVPSTVAPLMDFDLGTPDRNWEPPDPAEVEAARQAALAQAREEFGVRYAFVKMGDAATLEQTFRDFEVVKQFDDMIEKSVKQLLLVRGVKSVSLTSSSAPLPRIPGPPKTD